MQRDSAVLPGSGRFDAFRLVRERQTLSGSLDAAALPRIADRLADEPAPIRWRISGTVDEAGRAALDLDIEGELPLTCQRCLGVYRWPVDQHTEVLIGRSAEEVASLDDRSDLEVVLASAPVDPVELVEDELVLAVPFAPRHPEDACAQPVT
jgi:uncharacterized protein